ncbi:MAG TPA: hypothetical protein VH866_06115 [Candidatus Deferrimicrobiaceae bacterium]|jgi:hypothetical protein
MKKEKFLVPMAVLAALGLMFSAAAFAAEEAPKAPAAGDKMPAAVDKMPAVGDRYQRMFDPKTVETISGEVVQVKKLTHRRRVGYGVHLLVKTEKEEIPVSLGPSWYLDKQEVKIAEKDKVEVKGSRITLKSGKPAIIAAEVKKGDAILKLRGADGAPAWSRR